MNFNQFANRHNITSVSEWAPDNPNMEIWDGATHWKVTLQRGRKRMTVPFSQGSAHIGNPKTASVLECLVSDASSADEDFESWCANFGFDTDSRKAERTYKAVQTQTRKLRNFLGELYDEALQVEG